MKFTSPTLHFFVKKRTCQLVQYLWSYDRKKLKNHIHYLFGYTNFEFSKLDFLTSSYHNSTNTGPIDMIFTEKCNYFSRGTRWDHPFLSQSQRKGCNCSLKLTSDFICHRLYCRRGREFCGYSYMSQVWPLDFFVG